MEQNTSLWPASNSTYPVFVNMSPRSKTVHKELTSASQEKRTKEIVLKNTESTCFTAGQQIIGKHKGVLVLLSFPPCPEQSTKQVSKAHGALLTACRYRVVLPLAGRNVPEQYATVHPRTPQETPS